MINAMMPLLSQNSTDTNVTGINLKLKKHLKIRGFNTGADNNKDLIFSKRSGNPYSPQIFSISDVEER